MRDILVLLLVLLASSASPDVRGSEELRFEVLGGGCRYTEVGNYVWHNEAYPHHLDMTSACALIAVSKISRNAGDTHLGWRAAYFTMGKATTNAVFPMRDDEQISVLPDGSACDPVTWHGCIGRGYGTQSATGFTFGYVLQKDLWRMRFEVEGGLAVYEGRWRVDIRAEPPSKFHQVQYDWEGYQITPYGALALRYGYAVAMLRGYGRIRAAEHGCGACSGVANGPAYQAMVGLSVPF